MEISLKAAASIVGSLGVIAGGVWGFASFAGPYTVTKPPYENQKEANDKFNEIAQNFNAQNSNLRAMLQQQQLDRQQQLMTDRNRDLNMLAAANIALQRNPADPVARMQATAAAQDIQIINSYLAATP